MPTHAFTIRKLADAAGVGVEAVRYYHRRGLLPEGHRSDGGFREYSQVHVQRLLFIKQAVELGFSLDDVAELVSLSADHDQRRVREIAKRRVADIQTRVAQLQAMAQAMQRLVSRCERASPAADCPIIAALVDKKVTAQASEPRRRRAVPRVVHPEGAP